MGLKVSSKIRPNRLYFSSDNGDLIIMKTHPVPSCVLFEKFTKQEVIEISANYSNNTYSKGFSGAFLTKDYVYIVHTIKKDRKYCLCKLEIKEKADMVQMIEKNAFLISRQGVIEMFSFKCLKNNHFLKLELSFETNSIRNYDIYFIGWLSALPETF